MILRKSIIILFLLTNCFVYSQKGSLYLKNYSIPLTNINIAQNDIIQLHSGDIVLANNQGVILYNGVHWNIIPLRERPLTLYQPDSLDSRIYLINKNSLGFIKPDEKGSWSYVEILDSLADNSGYTKIYSESDLVFFFTEGYLYQYNTKNGELEAYEIPFEEISGAFNINNTFYFVAKDKKVYKFIDGSFQTSTQFPEESNISLSIPFSEDKTLIGTAAGHLFLFDGLKFESYRTNAQNYISGNQLTGGILINKEIFAFSTLTGGVVLVDKSSGEPLHFINFQNGLPDDEVNALFADDQQGLWVCHGLGVSRVDLALPVREYTQYPGLSGDITSVCKNSEGLFVGTNEGLFYLSKVQDISEVTHFIKKEQKGNTQFANFQVIKEYNKLIRISIDAKDTAQYGSLVKEIPITLQVPKDSVVNIISDEFKDQLIRNDYAISSIPYIFKKFPGLNARCKQFVRYDKGLLVATNSGLFQLEQFKLSTLIPTININYIFQDKIDSTQYLLATDDGLISVWHTENGFRILDSYSLRSKIYSIAKTTDGYLLGGENILFGIKLNNKGEFLPHWDIEYINGEIICQNVANDSIWILTSKAIYTIKDDEQITNLTEQKRFQPTSQIRNQLFMQPGYTWMLDKSSWWNLSDRPVDQSKSDMLQLFNELQDIFVDDSNTIWVVSNNSIYNIYRGGTDQSNRNFNSRVDIVNDKQNKVLSHKDLHLNYNKNSISVQLASPFYISEEKTQYQYLIQGLNKDWSVWDENSLISVQYLPPGNYEFRSRCKNVFGTVIELESFQITISPPFWQSWWFITLVVSGLIVLIWGIIRYRTIMLERENRRLQEKIEAATAEIVDQKTHIEKLYTNIKSSINYAQQIQEAILPEMHVIEEVLPESFILYKPQDIVSGDFYWFQDFEDYFIIIATDCTGHGVPGAFMSMIGNTLLNQIIREKGIIDPATILRQLDERIISSLKQDYEGSDIKDGMDLAVCTYFKKTKKMHFAGAMNSLYMIQNNELVRYEGEHYAVGGFYPFLKKEFNTHEIQLESTHYCYIFSDGYPDQLGGPGPKIRKYNIRKFRELLVKIHQDDFNEQKELLDETIVEWLGPRKQNDDILVIGFKLSV